VTTAATAGAPGRQVVCGGGLRRGQWVRLTGLPEHGDDRRTASRPAPMAGDYRAGTTVLWAAPGRAPAGRRSMNGDLRRTAAPAGPAPLRVAATNARAR
jgi:hypothetical protein